MIIELVEIENILSHKKTRLVIPRGVIAIIGPNGAGKTSIVDAITYTLFSVHSRGVRGTEKEPLLRHGTTHGKITVEFSVAGKKYRVAKMFSKRGETRAQLYVVEDNKVRILANSVRSVEAELKHIIGLDPKLAVELFFTRQGELEKILTNKDARIKLFDNIFGIKRMEKTYQELRKIIRVLSDNAKQLEELKKLLERDVIRLNNIKQEINYIKDRINKALSEARKVEDRIKEIEHFEKEYQDLREQKARLEGEKKQLEHELLNVEAEIEKLDKLLDDARKALKEITRLGDIDQALEVIGKSIEVIDKLVFINKQIKEEKARLDTLRQQIGAIEESRRLVDEYLKLKERINELEKDARAFEVVRSKLEDAKKKTNRLEQIIKNLSRDIRVSLSSSIDLSGVNTSEPDKVVERIDWLLSKLEEQLERSRKKRDEVLKEINMLEQFISDASDKLDRLSVARGACPLCGRPLDDEHRVELIKRLSREKKEAEKRLEARRDTLRRIEQEISELELRRKHLHQVLNTLRDKLAQFKQLNKELEETRREAEALNKEYLELYVSHKEYIEAKVRLRELEYYYIRYETLKDKVKEKERIEKKLAELSAEKERLYTTLTSLLVDFDEVREALDKGDLSEAKAKLRRLEQKIIALKEKAMQVNVLEDQLKALSERKTSIAKRLKKIEEQLREIKYRLEITEPYLEELNKLRELYNELRDEITRLEAQYTQLVQEAERLKESEKKFREVKERIERINKAKNDLERIRGILDPKRGLPRLIRQRSKTLMEAHLRDILEKFNFDFIDVQLTDDYDVIIHTRGGQRTVNMLSGGERVALAIAYRLALARTAAGRVDSLVMDEPTVHLDENRRRELIDIIRYGLESTGLAQLVVITHDEEVEEAADCIIEVKKENGESRIVRSCELAHNTAPALLTE